MYLQKIILQGFKSFASKTELRFCVEKKDQETERIGITAIVGPNGSGKSNVIDAVRWVMGEQSPKSLRASKSYDVIFSGSKEKPRMNSGSVTLVFDNSQKKLNVDYQNVSITRKVYRSGEGEYSINGSEVRLLDIIDIFASMGIGKESQCVLNQGMSDAILSASPKDRRSVLEEAAGVKPYQIKRDRSLKRLATTQKNLEITLRLLEEIEPRLKILKRQSKRAEQRREIEDQLRHVQRLYYRSLWKNLSLEYENFQHVFSVLEKEEGKLEQALGEYTGKQNSLLERLQETDQKSVLQNEILLLRREVSDLERQRAQCRGMIDAEKEKQKHQRMFDSIPVDLPFVRKRLLSLRKELEGITTFFLEEKDIEMEKKKSILENLLKSIDGLYDECAQSSVRVEREKEILQREKSMFDEKIRKGEMEYDALSQKISEKEKTILQKENELSLAETDTKDANVLYFSLEKDGAKVREELNRLRMHKNEKRVAFTRCEVHREDLEKEIRMELGLDPRTFVSTKDDETFEVREDTPRLIERLRYQLSMIGGIDPMVAQEYMETKERYEFLSRECEDLTQAMTSLETIIYEMNSRIEKDFSYAFKKINEEFGKYFSLMFDGGTASLEKVRVDVLNDQGEDNEESESEDGERKKEDAYSKWGVDIVVNPPKKKIDRLMMLSGGEKSLVSLALLFAIISHNPPPFVFLDEVEAALDEANSSRFGNLLRTLSSQTQFVVVTHNRETMRNADVLYGVTLEDGASNILSVRLDQIKKDGKIQVG